MILLYSLGPHCSPTAKVALRFASTFRSLLRLINFLFLSCLDVSGYFPVFLLPVATDRVLAISWWGWYSMVSLDRHLLRISSFVTSAIFITVAKRSCARSGNLVVFDYLEFKLLNIYSVRFLFSLLQTMRCSGVSAWTLPQSLIINVISCSYYI